MESVRTSQREEQQPGFSDLFFPARHSLVSQPAKDQQILGLKFRLPDNDSDQPPMIVISIANLFLQSLSNSRDYFLSLSPNQMGGITKLGLVVVISLTACIGYTALNAAEVALRLVVGTVCLVAVPFFFLFAYFKLSEEMNFFMMTSMASIALCAASFAGVVQGVNQVATGLVAAYHLMTNTDAHMPNADVLADTATFGLTKSLFQTISECFNN